MNMRSRTLLPLLILIGSGTCGGEPEIAGLARPEVREAISRLFSLQTKGAALKFRRAVWEEPFEINAKNPEEVDEVNRLVDAKSPRVVFIAGRLARSTGPLSHGFRVINDKDRTEATFGTREIDLCLDVSAQVVDISIEDKTSKAVVSVREDKRGLLLIIDDRKALCSSLFQSADGDIVFSTLDRTVSKRITLDAPNFESLVKQYTELAQVRLLRPLADAGVSIVPGKYLPPVMAVATGAFSPAAPDAAKKAGELIEKLGSDDQDTRESATVELIRLYPRAIHSVLEAKKTVNDQEVLSRLDRVIAAHPGILKAYDYVATEKLHENREYLKDILGNVPFFKAAARARLAALFGKDHGDDVKNWP